MNTVRTVPDSYERKLLELVLSHELPETCEVVIEIRSGEGKTASKLEFGRASAADRPKLSKLELRHTKPVGLCW